MDENKKTLVYKRYYHVFKKGELEEILLKNFDNIEILETDTVFYNNEIIQDGKKLIYVALYKPRGIECTLNEKIDQNLSTIINFEHSRYFAIMKNHCCYYYLISKLYFCKIK